MDTLTMQNVYDATGRQVREFGDSVATPTATRRTARLELNNGGVAFAIEAEVDPNTYPFRVTGGRIVSGVCGAPWRITGGQIGPQLLLTATPESAEGCAESITIVGEQQIPQSWRGTYGFGGRASAHTHTTLFTAWN